MIKTFFQIVLIFAALSFCGDKHYRGIVEFYMDVAKGNVPGHSAIYKFGFNSAIATTGEDVWAGGGTYLFYPDTAHGMVAVCDSSADSVGGAGALTVQVYGLDSNWSEINETITTAGTDEVALTNKYIRMYRAIVLTAGSYETNKGAITIKTAQGDTVGAYIAADDGQTQQAIYTVPAGKSAYYIDGYVSIKNDDKNGVDASFKLKMRPNTTAAGAWATKDDVSLINIGSSWFSYKYGVPSGPILEKTDIKIECYEASAESGATGVFDLVLVDD